MYTAALGYMKVNISKAKKCYWMRQRFNKLCTLHERVTSLNTIFRKLWLACQITWLLFRSWQSSNVPEIEPKNVQKIYTRNCLALANFIYRHLLHCNLLKILLELHKKYFLLVKLWYSVIVNICHMFCMFYISNIFQSHYDNSCRVSSIGRSWYWYLYRHNLFYEYSFGYVDNTHHIFL